MRVDVRYRADFVRFTSNSGHRSEVALTVSFDPDETFEVIGLGPLTHIEFAILK